MNTTKNTNVLRTIAILMGIVLFLLGGAGVTGAAANASIPGDALYPVKTTIEQARLSMAKDAGDRAQMKMAFAEQRLTEIDALVREGRYGEIRQAVVAFETEINSAVFELKTVAQADPARASLLATEITSTLTRYAQILSALALVAPDAVKGEVNRALDTTQIVGGMSQSHEDDVNGNDDVNDDNGNDDVTNDNGNANDDNGNDEVTNDNGNANDDNGNDEVTNDNGNANDDNGNDDSITNDNSSNDDNGNDDSITNDNGGSDDNGNDDSITNDNSSNDDNGNDDSITNDNSNVNDDNGNDDSITNDNGSNDNTGNDDSITNDNGSNDNTGNDDSVTNDNGSNDDSGSNDNTGSDDSGKGKDN